MRRLEVVIDEEETGSGARNDRPGLARLLDAARRGKIKYLLVWKLDRFGRSLIDVLTNVEELNRCGVTFVCVTQGLEIGPGGDAISRFVLATLGAAAEFERSLIAERTRLGIEKARLKGSVFGRPKTVSVVPFAVAQHRALGHTWREISEALGTSVASCRRAFSGFAKEAHEGEK